MKRLVTPNKHSEEIKNRYRTDTDTATDELNAHISACVNVTYLPDQYGISVLLTWDDKTILNETISGKRKRKPKSQ